MSIKKSGSNSLIGRSGPGGSARRGWSSGLVVLAVAVLAVASCSSATDDIDDSDTGTAPDRTTAASAPSDGESASVASSGVTEESGADQAHEDPSGGTADSATSDGSERSATSSGETFAVEAAGWAPCRTRFECATVSVPLDHQRPDGDTIALAMIRVAATGEARGSIFVNLGGPGASAVNSVANGYTLDDDTMADYHLIGFDPRGIGESNPLSCRIDLTGGPRPDSSPDDPDEVAQLDREAKGLADRCDLADGALLPHLGTDSVIRDLDLLRQAVGDQQLNYIGLSYGTLIGLRYAERYPTLVGRLVLDGVVDPAFTLTDLLRQQAGEFERAFDVLDEACADTLSCPDGGIIASYDRVAATLEDSATGAGIGPTELEVGALLALYSERLWPRLAEALIAAENGDYSGIERLHDRYVQGVNFSAYIAVSCIDSASPSGGPAWDRFAEELQLLSPRFGAALANEVRACAYWPTPAVGRPQPVAATGANAILVLSTTGDAATPLVNAATVADRLESAGLVVVEDEGHTAYGRNFCVERIVADYFDTGRVPDEVHRC